MNECKSNRVFDLTVSIPLLLLCIGCVYWFGYLCSLDVDIWWVGPSVFVSVMSGMISGAAGTIGLIRVMDCEPCTEQKKVDESWKMSLVRFKANQPSDTETD